MTSRSDEAAGTPPAAGSPVAAAIRFADLRSAGRDLAVRLEAYRGRPDVVVLALVRGGMPAAVEVADHLDAPLDLLINRKLLVPEGRDSMACAVTVGGRLVLDERVPPPAGAPQTPFDYFLADALEGLTRRTEACRGDRPPLDVAGKTVLLVDSGIRSGLTIRVATRALRTLYPARIVVATPVSAPECRAPVEALVDELVCLRWPEPFGHVGVWYAGFKPPDEPEIRALLDQADARRFARR